MADSNSPSKALSVTEAANLAKRTLESVRIVVEGEVSQVTDKRGYSAVYFSVKDENATLPCKMWRNIYEPSGVTLRPGMLVQLAGKFTYYGKSGSFSFDVRHLELAGEGKLRAQVAQLAEKLRLEGLMEPARKRPLPLYPQRIGLVTSPRGAAVRDVLRTLRRRYPLAEVIVCGVPVEGKNAPAQMTQALRVAAEGGAEVVLLVRGGGSFEDLMPFNDEGLARAVAALPVPVVTGIGHEPDNSICDMVADFRASTPTAAAETVAPEVDSIVALLEQHATHMSSFFQHKLEVTRLYLGRIADKPLFADENALLGAYMAAIDVDAEKLNRCIPQAMAKDAATIDSLGLRMKATAPNRFIREDSTLQGMEMRLHGAIPKSLSRDAAALESFVVRIKASAPGCFAQEERDLDALGTKMSTALPTALRRDADLIASQAARMMACAQTLVAPHDAAMRLCASRINDLSPLAVLGRGYALTRDAEGRIVRNVAQVEPGDAVNVTVSDGVLECTVSKTFESVSQ